MFLSIVIPLYNKEAQIPRAIRSVLYQSHRGYELIIVDDGSTDGSLSAARAFTDPRLRIVQRPNGGASAARNEGVRLARSQWVAFLDADDEYLPGFLEGMAAFIKSHGTPRLSFVACNILYGETGAASFPGVPTGSYNYFELCRHDATPATSSSTVVRRDSFLLAGGFPEGVQQYEDWTLWCKLAWLGDFGFLSTPLSCYHIASSGTASTSERGIDEFYADLMLLPTTVQAALASGMVAAELVPATRRYLNAYLLGQARLLRRKRARRVAWRILAALSVRHLDRRLLATGFHTVLLLLLPTGIKKCASHLYHGVLGRGARAPREKEAPAQGEGAVLRGEKR